MNSGYGRSISSAIVQPRSRSQAALSRLNQPSKPTTVRRSSERAKKRSSPTVVCEGVAANLGPKSILSGAPPYLLYRPEGRQNSLHDLRLVGVRDLLQRLGIGHRQVASGDTPDRRVEIVECLLLDQGGEVGPDAAVGPSLLDHDAAVRLAHRGED